MTTTNIGLATPAHGAEVDTWDVPVNDNSSKIDACFGSVTTKSLTNVNVVLTADESRVNILRFTGTLTGVVGIFPDTSIHKTWICENLTTGNFAVLISGGGNAYVGLPPGSCQVYWDGTNMTFVNLGRIGDYYDYPSSTVPLWIQACFVPPFLHANGGTFSAVTYPILNQILGGNTLPDTRGRYRATLDGGTSRITTAGGGLDGSTIFTGGGAQNRSITTNYLPATPPLGTAVSVTDTRTYYWPTQQQTINPPVGGSAVTVTNPAGAANLNVGVSLTGSGSISGNVTGNLGSGTALPTLPPTYIGGITMIRAG